MPRRVVFNTTIDERILKEVKKLAIDLDRGYNEVIEEAVIDLLKKHGRDARRAEDTVQGRLFRGRG